MKKYLGILIALVLALSLCLVPAVAQAAVPPSPPTIDGVASLTEWQEATPIPVTGDMGTVSVIAYPDYLYVLFVVQDSTDARKDENIHGNDQTSINVNPTAGVDTWGFPYDLIFETSADLPWDPKVDSGLIDGWKTRWFPDNEQQGLPAKLQSATIYSGANRVTEWKLPLVSEAGATLKVGGAIDVGDGSSYTYPVGLDWNDPTTFVDIPILANTIVGVVGDTGEGIVAIDVSPTNIDFGTVQPGQSSGTEVITVENIGFVPVGVTAMLDKLDTVFNHLQLDGKVLLSNWKILSLVGGASQGVNAQLVVPRTYSAKGVEEATLVFLATATP